ncbi:MAG: alpha/beta hydrolase [Candidatus Limnocylindrales bacterium]
MLHRSNSGPDLLVHRWSAVGEPWASVLIVHGLAEHGGRYERTGGLLADAGLAVEAVDLRGAGGSAGRRAHVERFSDYLDDVEWRLAVIREAAAGRPVILLGHSLGGLVCLDYATSRRPLPDLLILSSPAIASTIPSWKKALARTFDSVAPTVRVANGVSGDQLSRDPAVGEAYFGDPLVEVSSTFRLGAESFRVQDRVRRSSGRLSIPTFVTHGEADPIVPVASSEYLAALPGVTRTVYPGLRHETLNEPEGPALVADMLAWLRAQVGDPGTGGAR